MNTKLTDKIILIIAILFIFCGTFTPVYASTSFEDSFPEHDLAALNQALHVTGYVLVENEGTAIAQYPCSTSGGILDGVYRVMGSNSYYNFPDIS